MNRRFEEGNSKAGGSGYPSPLQVDMKVIPAKIAEEIHRGSYEHVIRRVEEAVAEGHQKFGAATSSSAELIATFAGHAVVMNESGEFFRAKFENLDSGGIAFIEVEQFDVPVLETREQKHRYMEEAAGQAVVSLFSGDYQGARERVQELVRSSEYAAPQTSLEALKERVSAVFDDGRPWRMFFESFGTPVRKYIWGSSGAIARYSPKPKYQHLYMGEGKSPDGHAEAISGDLDFMLSKLTGLWEMFEAAWPKYQDKHNHFSGLELAGIAEKFEGFATDFADELKTVCRLAESATKDTDGDNTMARAMIYDSLARRYPDLAVAARFIQKVSTELAGQ
jgi:hypothetical protein